MLLAEKLPLEQARRFLRISHTALSHIVSYWVNKRVEQTDLSDVFALCIDDTSFRRGQSYVTVVIDASKRRVIDVEEGRSAQQVWEFSEVLEARGGECTKITQVASDMAASYLSGIRDCFPKAQVVIDRFHVSQLMRDAMDEVRRKEQGEKLSRNRKSGKKLLMIPKGRMNEQQQEKLDVLSKLYPKTGRAFRMVQALDQVYTCNDILEAEDVFDKLYSWLRRSRLDPMKRVAQTLRQYKSEILAFYFHRLTNAVAEGINSIIQAGKRKARGFATFKGFSTMIYLECSKLSFAPVNLFS
jgi:transposase